jgi:hypothetical protein
MDWQLSEGGGYVVDSAGFTIGAAQILERFAELEDLLADIAACGVVLDDERLRYVEVQIDQDTWEHLRRITQTRSSG